MRRHLVGSLLLLLLALSLVVDGQRMKKQKGNKGRRKGKGCCMMPSMEKNISELWNHVRMMQQPVHVHVHGPMDDDDHEQHGGHGHPFDEHDDLGHNHEEELGDPDAMKPNRKHKSHGHHGHHHEGHRDHSGSGHPHHHRPGHRRHDEEDHDHHGGDVTSNGTHVHIHLHVDGVRASRMSEEEHMREQFSDVDFIFGRCDMVPNSALPRERQTVRGSVLIRQKPQHPDEMRVQVDLSGLSKGRDSSSHGFHVHEFGDFHNGCNSLGGHYNPHGTHHAGPGHTEKHVGDWGNVEADRQGIARTQFDVHGASLYGPHSIFGRSIVVHMTRDDLGQGGTDASRTSGDAGARLACCIIGRASDKSMEMWET